jgi:hypothetical protein
MLYRTSELDGFFGTTKAMENGYEIWNMKCQKSAQGRSTENSRSNGSSIGKM